MSGSVRQRASARLKKPRPALNINSNYTMDEAALIARVSWHTVQRACKTGTLRHCRIGTRVIIRGNQLANFLRDSEAEAA